MCVFSRVFSITFCCPVSFIFLLTLQLYSVYILHVTIINSKSALQTVASKTKLCYVHAASIVLVPRQSFSCCRFGPLSHFSSLVQSILDIIFISEVQALRLAARHISRCYFTTFSEQISSQTHGSIKPTSCHHSYSRVPWRRKYVQRDPILFRKKTFQMFV